MPPIDPCGAPVDLLRQCYSAKMRFYQDDCERLLTVNWYFVDRTDFVPPGPFVSSVYDEIPDTTGEPVGEDATTRKHRPGSIPPGTGLKPLPAGTVDQWAGDVYLAQRLKAGSLCGPVETDCAWATQAVFQFPPPCVPFETAPVNAAIAPQVRFEPTPGSTGQAFTLSGWTLFKGAQVWNVNHNGIYSPLTVDAWAVQLSAENLLAIGGTPDTLPGAAIWLVYAQVGTEDQFAESFGADFQWAQAFDGAPFGVNGMIFNYFPTNNVLQCGSQLSGISLWNVNGFAYPLQTQEETVSVATITQLESLP